MKGPDADGLWEFRYYRIPLTPAEIYQYVEANRAYLEYMAVREAGADFDAALDALSAPEFARRVRRYEAYIDGEPVDLRGCFASFLPDGMEVLVCGGRRDRYEELPEQGEERDRLAQLMQIINNFPLVARLLRDRQQSRPDYTLENEYDVQDLLFAVVRAVFEDASARSGHLSALVPQSESTSRSLPSTR